jgi:hypothetical protein
MRNLFLVSVLFLASVGYAESPSPYPSTEPGFNPVSNPSSVSSADPSASADPRPNPGPSTPSVLSSYTARTGEQFQAPHILTYGLVEYSQQRGRWIFPDIGVYAEAHSDGQLIFAGVGGEFHPSRRATLTQIVYYSQDTDSHHARMIWLWPVLDLRFTPRLSAEAVAYPTIPLNKAATAGFDIDRVKLEYALNRRLTVGPGYSASICDGGSWQNKPFGTTTLNTRLGSFEFWVERIHGGGQLQMRYQLNHIER